MNPSPQPSRPEKVWQSLKQWADKPVSLVGHLLLMAVILAAPCWLFGIARMPSWVLPETSVSPYIHQFIPCRLHSDDFAYIGSSRNLSRTIDNLFVPHNTHICPSWRVLTWALVKFSGDLTDIPIVLGWATYAGLAILMLVTGHFVAHESRRMSIGFFASLLVGVTSLQWLSTVWYSAGQTFWAAIFIVISLILAQEWLKLGWQFLWLPLVACCWIAGGFWTIGHASGPVTAIYILCRTSGRRRLLSAVPMLATTLSIIVSLAVGGQSIDATNSFHGRNIKEAVDPVRGLVNSCHSIFETLLLGNLGVNATTTDLQSFVLVALTIAAWAAWHLRSRRPIHSLEWAGSALFVSSYMVEWTFRGYFSWVALKNVVPWYDTIPQVGWVIFLSGIFQASLFSNQVGQQLSTSNSPTRISRLEFTGILGSLLIIILLHQPEIERILIESQPPLIPYEVSNRMFPISNLKRLRAVYIWDERVKWQRRQLARLQQAEQIALGEGWSIDQVSAAVGRVRLPMIPRVYDAVYLMNLPLKNGKNTDPDRIRRALGPLLALEAEPVPEWLRGKGVKWPPEGWETKE